MLKQNRGCGKIVVAGKKKFSPEYDRYKDNFNCRLLFLSSFNGYFVDEPKKEIRLKRFLCKKLFV